MAGAAAATVLGQIVAAIMAVVMNLKCNPDVNIRLREIRWNGHVAGKSTGWAFLDCDAIHRLGDGVRHE